MSPVVGANVGAGVAEVAVTLPVPGRYHYLVPASLAGRARVGARVLVRFGNKKVTGVVVPAVSKPPVGIKLVELSEVLDDDPALSPELVDLCLWVADYYEAPPGEAMRAALPAGSGISAQRFVALTDAGRTALDGNGAALPGKQHALLARLASGPMSATGQNEATRRGLEALRERGLVEDQEKRDVRVRLKTERVAVLIAATDAHVGAATNTPRIDGAASNTPRTDADVGAASNAPRTDAHVGATSDARLVVGTDAHVGAATNTPRIDGAASNTPRTDARLVVGTDAHVGAATNTPLDTHVGAASNTLRTDAHVGAATNTARIDGAASNTPRTDARLVVGTDAHVGAATNTPRTDADVGAASNALLTGAHVGAASDASLTDAHVGAASNAPRTDAHVGAAAKARPDVIANARAAFARAPKKLAALDALVAAEGHSMPVAALNKIAAGVVAQLVKLGAALVIEREVALDAAPVGDAMSGGAPPELTAEQAHAVAEITAAMALEPSHLSPSPPSASPNASQSPSPTNASLTTASQSPTSGAPSPTNASLTTAPQSPTNGAPPSTTEPASPPATAPTRKPFLLHGVTGSGKTEVYLRVIAKTLEAGKTALVLVPEISLTPQLAARFRARFGDKVAILHSGLTEQQRLGEWSRLHRGEATIAVGARSAVFAPLTNIGVIVVDEEHDGSFKQDEGVRYHGRDVALVRAQRAGAVCVLGSATPSLESYAHAERGAYKLLVLTKRPTARPMPEVQIVDLRTHMPDGDAFLSSPLRNAIGETLAKGDQAILFLNRRGFATFVLCRACGHSFRCDHCSVSLTYHRNTDRLDCHYCGTWQRIPETCPSCAGKDTIVRKGLGTEKVADAVAAEFPKARVARLDRDVASGAKIEGVLSRVARREVDILVGTQMVTKGHDFPGVTLVGVLCADTGLNVPDFRASERTFQLLAQVAGRAGRGERAGRVIIQTYRPGSAAVTCAAAHDYQSFFASESAARADPDLMYPPHGRLIAVRIDGPNATEIATHSQRLAQVAEAVARRPENEGHVVVRGAVPAPIEKLRNRTRWQIWLRGSDRAALRRVARAVLATDVPAKVRVGLDVDPISTL